MQGINVGQKSLLGYLPAILIQNILNNKIKKNSKPPISIDMTTVSLFADISGFTKLSEAFSKKGRTGSEFLAFCLNRYMELLINIISKNGGDIFKFAGDALLVIWPQEKNGDMITPCRRALQCALQIISKLDKLEMSKGRILSVKIGLGFGTCKVLLVGGKFDRFECLVVGEAMRQACTSECHCKGGGETVVSEDVYKKICKYYNFVEAEPDTEHGPGDGLKYYKFIKEKTGDKIQIRADAFLMRTQFKGEVLKHKYSELKKFVPAAIAIYLDIEKEVWSKESRLLTIMFLNLTIDLTHTKSEEGLQYIQNIIKVVQSCIYRTRGSLNKFLMDDKGSVLLIAWGLPPISAHDDPLRAVLTGINIINELKNLKCDKWDICGAKIGITTGCCFSGVCGNIGNRREYSLLGEIVNLSARYMQQAMKMCSEQNKKYQLVLCENTKNLIQYQISCRWVAKGMCKGFTNEFNFYEPIESDEDIYRVESLIKTRRDNPIFDKNGKLIKSSIKQSIFIVGRDDEINKVIDLFNLVINKNESKFIVINGILGSGKSLFLRRILYEFFEKYKTIAEQLPSVNKKNNYPFIFITSQLPTSLTTSFNGCVEFLKKIYPRLNFNKEKNKNIKFLDFELKTNEFGENLIKNNFFHLITFIDEILEINILSEHFNISKEINNQLIDKHIIQFDQNNYDPYFQKRNFKGYNQDLVNFFTWMVKEYCEKCLKKLPLILIIEDTHLVDTNTIQLVNNLHSIPKTFIACTFQTSLNPFETQFPPFFDSDEEFEFRGLSNYDDIIEMIQNFCEKNKQITFRSIKQDTLRVILERSFKNNPLFILEIIESLLDQEQIYINENKVLVSSPIFIKYNEILDWSKLNIPFLLEKIVGNIIDSLKCTEIIILKHASVIGTIFDVDKLNKLNILNNITLDELIQIIYNFAQKGVMEILYDLEPKKLVAKFSIPFLKEILYKRMLVETKNEIHLKVARLMESSKFNYLPKQMETNLLNFHLIEEEKTILDHLSDTNEEKNEQIKKEANLKIKVLKETTDKIKDIDLRVNEIEDNIKSNNSEIVISKSSMPIIKHGTIEKKSDKGISWVPRFVVTTKTRFFYWYTSKDYEFNKQYLGMFELKHIYDIKVLRDFEFSDKRNLLQIKVSAYYKKDQLKGERDYIFSINDKDELNAWVIVLNFLRAKAIYDEFRFNFGNIYFPFIHEKKVNNWRKIKRNFHLKLNNKNNEIYMVPTFYGFSKKKSEKKSSIFGLNTTLIIEKKEETENELIVKLKERVEVLSNLTIGYFIGIIQNRIYNFESDLPDNIFNEPNHLKKYKNNPYFKKLKEENENKLNRTNSSVNISHQNTFNINENKKPTEEKQLRSLLKNNKSKNRLSIDEINKDNDKNSVEEEEENITNRSHSRSIKSFSNNNELNMNSNGIQIISTNSKKQNGIDMDAKDKLQNLQINLKDDILEEQIKLLISTK